jgi:hypothetical protein
MTFSLRYAVTALSLLGLGCRSDTTSVVTPLPSLPAPEDLAYQLDPSGDPNRPAGVLLVWGDVTSSALASYRIYSRGSTASAYGLRGETSSNTFHDNGVPHLQYFVTAVAVDGGESDPSSVVTVNEFLRIPRPMTITSISLNRAIHLDWDDAPFLSDPARFKWYRVYSATYNLDTDGCIDDWALEGTTVANEFLAAQLNNGEPRCFAASAVDTLGYESLWSPLWQDTPRPDARNVLVYAFAANAPQSGFRFWQDANGNGEAESGELGLVQDGTRTDIDFWIARDPADSSLWFVPEFAGA